MRHFVRLERYISYQPNLLLSGALASSIVVCFLSSLLYRDGGTRKPTYFYTSRGR